MLVGGGEYTVVEILKYLVQNDKINLEEKEDGIIYISARENKGIDELKLKISEMLFKK